MHSLVATRAFEDVESGHRAGVVGVLSRHFDGFRHVTCPSNGEMVRQHDDATRGVHYRGPWRLPGPDSHRLAIESLRSLRHDRSVALLASASRWTHVDRGLEPGAAHQQLEGGLAGEVGDRGFVGSI
jgi:hypothetical protein